MSVVAALAANIGRYTDKTADWDAFPHSEFPELRRGQFRYIGAGGSPRVDDPNTLKPHHFTLSLVHKPVGHYAPSHSHEVVEHFMVLDGVLTVGWIYGEDVIEAKLGPNDLVLNKSGRPHGFRNDGPDPVLMQVTVGSGTPLPPNYVFPPTHDKREQASRFGAEPGHTIPFDARSQDPRHKEMAGYIVRASQLKHECLAKGVHRSVYVGEGGANPATYRLERFDLQPGAGIKVYSRDVEDAFLVLKGCLIVGWHDGDEVAEQCLGVRDLVLNAPNQSHWFENRGIEPVAFLMYIGTRNPDDFKFIASNA